MREDVSGRLIPADEPSGLPIGVLGEREPLWEGHRERLRVRAERLGWRSVQPRELLEMLLTFTEPRQDCADLARSLVEHFGTLGGVLLSPAEDLMQVDGMDAETAAILCQCGAVLRAYMALWGEDGVHLGCFREVRDFLRQRAEVFREYPAWLLLVNFEFELICFRRLDSEPSWHGPENVRAMVAEAVSVGAHYAFIVLHADDVDAPMDEWERRQLEGVAYTLHAVKVELLDVVLMSGDALFSLNMQGGMDVLRVNGPDGAVYERREDVE